MESETEIIFIKNELIDEIKQENLSEIQEYENYDLHSEFYVKEEPRESVPDPLEEKTNEESHFVCKYCDNRFDSVNRFMDHVNEHSLLGNLNHRCNLCNESFKNLSDLHKHESNVHFKSDFKCNTCLKYFTKQIELITHLSTSHLKLLVCPECNKVCSNTKILNQHVLTHQLRYKCSKCPARFFQSTGLKLHQKLHKTFVCNCNRKFETYSGLLSHAEEHKNSSDEFYQICMPCQMHENELSVIKCFCNVKPVKSLTDFTKHFLRRHQDHLPNICLNCKSIYKKNCKNKYLNLL